MKTYYTIPEYRSKVDPTGRGAEFVNRFQVTAAIPVPGLFSNHTSDEWKELYMQSRKQWERASRGHELLRDFDDEHVSKYGPQGDGFSLEELLTYYESSYTLAQRSVSIGRVLQAGKQYLLDRICAKKGADFNLQYPQRTMYNASAALPTMLKKGDYIAESFGVGEHYTYPNLPGQKSQRQKHRVINQDACGNVRAIERELAAVRNWLKSNFPEYFSAWLNPSVHLGPAIYRHLVDGACFAVETDYKACDEHFSWQLAQATVLDVYEQLLTPVEFVKFASRVEDLFYQPLYLGKTEVRGLHNLFSGQGITNDFETIYGVMLTIGSLLVNGIDPEECVILVCGDDITVLIRRKRELCDQVRLSMLEEGEIGGMEWNLDKSCTLKGCCTFCRRIYYPRLPVFYNSLGKPYWKGAYPTILSLNSTVNPWKYSVGSAVPSSAIQQMDNVQGSPWFRFYVQFLVKQSRTGYYDVRSLQPDLKDWWARVYGETWDPETSPALTVLKQSNMLSKWFL